MNFMAFQILIAFALKSYLRGISMFNDTTTLRRKLNTKFILYFLSLPEIKKSSVKSKLQKVPEGLQHRKSSYTSVWKLLVPVADLPSILIPVTVSKDKLL